MRRDLLWHANSRSSSQSLSFLPLHPIPGMHRAAAVLGMAAAGTAAVGMAAAGVGAAAAGVGEVRVGAGEVAAGVGAGRLAGGAGPPSGAGVGAGPLARGVGAPAGAGARAGYGFRGGAGFGARTTGSRGLPDWRLEPARSRRRGPAGRGRDGDPQSVGESKEEALRAALAGASATAPAAR